MSEYYVLSRKREDTDTDGYYRSMSIVGGPYSSHDEAWDEARSRERDHAEAERDMKRKGMLHGVIIPATNYHVLSQDEIDEGRRLGIRIR